MSELSEKARADQAEKELDRAYERYDQAEQERNYWYDKAVKKHAQVESVLAVEPREMKGSLLGSEIDHAYGYNEALKDIRRAIEEAGG